MAVWLNTPHTTRTVMINRFTRNDGAMLKPSLIGIARGSIRSFGDGTRMASSSIIGAVRSDPNIGIGMRIMMPVRRAHMHIHSAASGAPPSSSSYPPPPPPPLSPTLHPTLAATLLPESAILRPDHTHAHETHARQRIQAACRQRQHATPEKRRYLDQSIAALRQSIVDSRQQRSARAKERWAKIAQQPMRDRLQELFPPPSVGCSAEEFKRFESSWRLHATRHGWTEVDSLRQFRMRFLQPRSIELEWPLSTTTAVLSGPSEYVLAQVPSVGALNSVWAGALGWSRWHTIWTRAYPDTKPDQIPEPQVRRGMAQVILRDTIVIKAAPFIHKRDKQDALYLAYHQRLRDRMTREYEKVRRAESPPTRRTVDSHRASNLAFFARLATSDHAPSESHHSHSHSHPDSTITDRLWTTIDADRIADMQKIVVTEIEEEYGLPVYIIRRVLQAIDMRLQQLYQSTATAIESQMSLPTIDSSRPLQLDHPALCEDAAPIPPASLHHAGIHLHLLSDPCYAFVGGLRHSLPSRSPHQRLSDRRNLASTILAVRRAMRDSQLGYTVVQHGLASRINPTPPPINTSTQTDTQATPESKPDDAPRTYTQTLDADTQVHEYDPSASPGAVIPAASVACESDSVVTSHSSLRDLSADGAADQFDDNDLFDDDGDVDGVDDGDSGNLAPGIAELLSPRVPLSSLVKSSRRQRAQLYHASKFQRRVEAFLDAKGIRYIKEFDVDGMQPDLFLLDDLRIRVSDPADPSRSRLVTARWLELKAMYGACVEYAAESRFGSRVWPSPVCRGWVEQAQRYVEAIGPGAVVFESGFCQEWNKYDADKHDGDDDGGAGGDATAGTVVSPARLPREVIFLHLPDMRPPADQMHTQNS